MEHWHTVYTVASRGPKFGLMAFSLLLVAIGLGVYAYNKAWPNDERMPLFNTTKRRYNMGFGLVFAALAGLITLAIIPSSLADYAHTQRVYEQKQYQTVEGTVANFDPMPAGGHWLETFTVAGVPFAFSDFNDTDYGYNNTASHGGVIRQGLHVRIAYMPSGERNVILKLEIPTAEPNAPMASTTGTAPIWQTRTYRIEGMTCEACARHVESAVQQVPGVQSMAVSFDQATAQVRYNSAQAQATQVESAINGTGYHVQNPSR